MKFILDGFEDLYMLWSIIFFYCCLYTYGKRIILWIICLSKTCFMNVWSYTLILNDSNSFFRLCSAMRSNEFSRCNGHYKFNCFYSIYRYDALMLLWGGFSIDFVTLDRFFVLHFSLPFLLTFFTIIHLVFLHEYGSIIY